MKLCRVKGSADQPGYKLNLNEVNFLDCPQDLYGKYLSGYLPWTIQTKGLLLKSDWKPEDFSRDAVAGWILPFLTLDPTGDLFLTGCLYWGAIDEGLAQADRLGWGQTELGHVEKVMTTKLGEKTETDETGNKKTVGVSFLSKKQISWINRRIKAGVRAFVNDMILSGRGVVRVRK